MEEEYEHLELTEEQLKAAKSVYRAMRKASKLGVQFWDDYGTLACYNGNMIRRMGMDEREPGVISIRDNPDIAYDEILDNFFPGNADDEVFAELHEAL